jgi:hypothetical protein
MKHFVPQVETSAIIGNLRLATVGALVLASIVYLLAILPLSFLDISDLKIIWNALIYFLSSLAFIFAAWNLSTAFTLKTEKVLIQISSIFTASIIVGLSYFLIFVGLIPPTLFIPGFFLIFHVYYILSLEFHSACLFSL